MGEIGGPRQYHGAGLGQPTAWTCPGCSTQHTTRLEDGCSVCLATDAQRDRAVAGTVTDITKLADAVMERIVANYTEVETVRGVMFTEPARQSLAVALAHFVEHGAPDATLLSKPVMIGWARELAGLGGDDA